MAYKKNQLSANSSHYTCPFSEQNYEAHTDVDIQWEGTTGFCQHGRNCLAVCPHSWRQGTEKDKRARLLHRNSASMAGALAS